MSDPTRHHRRIRLKAHAVHWGLWPLALLVPGAWLYLALDACQETTAPLTLALCRWSRLVPLAPAALGLLAAAWIVWDLIQLGVEHRHDQEGGERPRARLHHAAHGYRALGDRHRRHVHLAFAQAVLVALALAAWLAWQVYRTTY